MEVSKPDKAVIPSGVLSEAEALAILERIFGGNRSDAQFGTWVEQLKRATGCPNVLDLIKHRKESETPTDLLRRAREYRPIQL
jgi:hypothetical protein